MQTSHSPSYLKMQPLLKEGIHQPSHSNWVIDPQANFKSSSIIVEDKAKPSNLFSHQDLPLKHLILLCLCILHHLKSLRIYHQKLMCLLNQATLVIRNQRLTCLFPWYPKVTALSNTVSQALIITAHLTSILVGTTRRSSKAAFCKVQLISELRTTAT
jgi:hypothetical protein